MTRRFILFFSLLFLCVHFLNASTVQDEPVHIVACPLGQAEDLKRFCTSAARFGVSVEIIASSKAPKIGQKIIDLKRYLKKLPVNDVVLIVDSGQVLMLEPPVALLEKFKNMKASFVIAAEKFCPSFYELEETFPPSPYGFRYPCSGAYMGYVWAVLDVLNSISPEIPKAEEEQLMLLGYVKHPEKYTLDYSCELFIPLDGVDDATLYFDPATARLESLTTGTRPALVLGEGSGSYIYDWVYDQLHESPSFEDRAAI